ncbi:MAG: Uncharacterized protein G01um10147_369 [Microgenomates group bacterium Gr01-1014_7]|nr:MAG: Uncharacterized protein G01um10147_369 [Microgenomates group bacterium Gr01-1014_7]
MGKIVFIRILISLLLLCFQNVSIVQAQSISVSVSPNPVSVQDNAHITVSNLRGGQGYILYVKKGNESTEIPIYRGGTAMDRITHAYRQPTGTSLSFEFCPVFNPGRIVYADASSACRFFDLTNYTVTIRLASVSEPNPNPVITSGPFTVISGVRLSLSTTTLTISATNIQAILSNLRSNMTYRYYIQKDSGQWQQISGTINPDTSGNLSMAICSIGDIYVYHRTPASTCQSFQAGNYNIKITGERAGQEIDLATASFVVSSVLTSSITCTNPRFTSGDNVQITIPGVPDGIYKVSVDGRNPTSGTTCNASSGGNIEFNLGTYDTGPHTMSVMESSTACNSGNVIAQGGFTISNDPSQPGSCTASPPDTVVSPAPSPSTGPGGRGAPAGSPAAAGGIPCDGGKGFKTAIGCVHTDPVGFTKDFLTFIIAIGGGFAFLMMLLGAFQMLTSAGNPETLATGKDRFTNAIIGLLMVIFAVLLMQIIGFDILRLPGFAR